MPGASPASRWLLFGTVAVSSLCHSCPGPTDSGLQWPHGKMSSQLTHNKHIWHDLGRESDLRPFRWTLQKCLSKEGGPYSHAFISLSSGTCSVPSWDPETSRMVCFVRAWQWPICCQKHLTCASERGWLSLGLSLVLWHNNCPPTNQVWCSSKINTTSRWLPLVLMWNGRGFWNLRDGRQRKGQTGRLKDKKACVCVPVITRRQRQRWLDKE